MSTNTINLIRSADSDLSLLAGLWSGEFTHADDRAEFDYGQRMGTEFWAQHYCPAKHNPIFSRAFLLAVMENTLYELRKFA